MEISLKRLDVENNLSPDCSSNYLEKENFKCRWNSSMSLVNITTIPVTTHWSSVTYSPSVVLVDNDGPLNQSEAEVYEAITTFAPSITLTDTVPQWKVFLNKMFALTMPFILLTLSLAMGCHVYWKEVIGNFWPPFAIGVGLVGQFVILPALAFGITVALRMEPYVALGCLIISCSPGGAFSNFFAYWVSGDVSLSLVMTTCSTLLAFGGMPFNLWLYSARIIGEDSDSITVPYKSILISLGYVCLPVITGMVIRHFTEKVANKITRVLSIFGYFLIATNTLLMLILYWEAITTAPASLHFGAMILPISGISLAYLVAFVSGRSHKICRTIGIETASQNASVAFGIIFLSFSEIEIRNRMVIYPTLYMLYMLLEICSGALVFVWFQNRRKSLSSPSMECVATKI